MKDILKSIYSKLIANTDLKTALGYTSSHKNIRSFESLKQYDFDRYLLFGKLTSEQFDTDLDTSDVRRYSMQIQILDRNNNITVDDISEQVIDILHGTTLEEAGSMKSRLVEFERSLPCFYDNTLEFYIQVSYYNMIITKLN